MFYRSTRPCICGLYSVLVRGVINSSAHIDRTNFDLNCGPLSASIVHVTQRFYIQCSKNSFATASAVIRVVVMALVSAEHRSAITIVNRFSDFFSGTGPSIYMVIYCIGL